MLPSFVEDVRVIKLKITNYRTYSVIGGARRQGWKFLMKDNVSLGP